MGFLDDLCRICADKLQGNRVNVLTPENSHLLTTIMQCLPIMISEDDSFPKNVCSNCLATLNSIHELRSKSLRAVDIFKDAVESVLKTENLGLDESLSFQVIKEEHLPDIEFSEEPETKFVIEDCGDSDPLSFECVYCFLIFESENGLRTHICPCSESAHGVKRKFEGWKRDSDGLFRCRVCGKGFPSVSKLARHLPAHSGGKPYKCKACDKCFSRKANLIAHQSIHSGEKPFRCEECGKSFSIKSYLTTHQHRHKNTYQCPTCSKSFARKIDYNTHQRVHTGEKPFACQKCGKFFAWLGDLTKHRCKATLMPLM